MDELKYNWRTFLSVQRPGRYVDSEWNCIITPPESVCCRMVLAFPDVYEIGMSYHGFKILYERINACDEFSAERAFAPWVDAESLLRQHRQPLRSLETASPLAEFDVIGFTLQHELSYTNILTMLDISGLPLLSVERTLPLPLIIAGGEGAFSPEPLAEFLDAFVLGDGEEVTLEILQAIKDFKAAGSRDKEELLTRLATIPGVYVPSFYAPEYTPDGALQKMRKLKRNAPDVVKARRFDLASDVGPIRPVVPNLRITQERFAIEVRRGCTYGCRFCQAGMTTRPVRERPPEQILEIARTGIRNTGFDEISLLALSTADYSRLPEVISSLGEAFSSQGVNISLPSIRINAFDIDLINSLQSVRKSGLTLAPEAGTERLRHVINKPVDDALFLDIVRRAFASGRRTLKLYFMIALPTETTEDLDGICRLLRETQTIARKLCGRKFNINVTLSPFVPKAHTPFQWEAQPDVDELRRRINYIRRGVKSRNIIFKAHNVHQSRIEAVFARGDRRLAKALLRAWELGCRFDGWEETFRSEIWQRAFDETGINPDFYVSRKRGEDEVFPWDHLFAGVTKEFLLREFRRALAGELTPDCTTGACSICGACPERPANILASQIEEPFASAPSHSAIRIPHSAFEAPPIQRLRLTYSKRGTLCLTSHLDLAKTMLLILKRSQLPVAFTQGYNPQPKVQYGPPLTVGFEGEGEVIDIFLSTRSDLKEVLKRLRSVSPQGLQFKEIEEVLLGAPSIGVSAVAAEYRIGIGNDLSGTLIERQLESFYTAGTLPVTIQKKARSVQRDLKRSVLKLEPMPEIDSDMGYAFTLRLSLKPEDYIDPRYALMHILNLPEDTLKKMHVLRTLILLHYVQSIT